ncbi:pseudouridine synthase family protein [Methylophaga sp.]|uniref:pseudouridine synthase family protein n=1 Tax=Methylophaga sp. TaxID=2024840 RepID=UPI003F698F4E
MSSSLERFEKHITVTETGQIAVDILAAETCLSKQLLKKVMLKGAVWLTTGKKTQRLRRAKRELQKGQALHLYYDADVLERKPTPPELIADLGHYSIWNKPYGVLSQGSKWGDHCTVTRWAEQHLTPERNAFVVHRLDRAANGLIIVAHEKQAAALLSGLFQSRQIDKRYRVWVKGEFPSTATENSPVNVDLQLDGRHASSFFTRLTFDADKQQSLLDVHIETGRKHQIRRHVSSLGYPVVGDRLYGNTNDQVNLQLTAYYLSFMCPYSQKIKKFNLLSDSDALTK